MNLVYAFIGVTRTAVGVLPGIRAGADRRFCCP